MSGKYYFEHDDRGPSTSTSYSNYNRSAFAMGRHKDRKHRNSGYPGGKSHLGEGHAESWMNGDVDMGDTHSKKDRRFNPYAGPFGDRGGGRSNKSRKNGKHRNNRGMHQNEHTWYRITIPHGRKLGKEFILRSINSLTKTNFTPYNFQFSNKNNADFYVNGHTIASEIREVNRRVTTPDGFKMVVLLQNVSAPHYSIDSSVIETMKTAMSACYDPQRHSLNLMKFHEMDTLKMNGLYVSLSKTGVFQPVLKIIKENIPELEILILSNNRIYSLEPAACLVSGCKRLKSIDLSNNKLRRMSELNFLKGLDLQEIVLDGNPLCDDYKDKTSYISAVRERFPKLRRLDGHDLPAPIGFDLGNETLPASKKSFFAADDVKDMVIQFLDAYYSVYDSGERLKLLDAYHEQAVFSLCLSINTANKNGQGAFGAYVTLNRNLLRVTNNNGRFKYLKQGKLSVVSALQELPQTMHDPSSFSIDIFHVSPGLMSFSVVGVFKEVGAEIHNATLKTFSRTFVVIPQGTGFVIVNETLFIAHASSDQQEKAFKVPAPTPSPSPAPPIEERSTMEKQTLVIELSKQSGMNLDFSSKCLEENDWDFPKALAVFMKFQSEGKLPPEAFIR